MFILGQTVATPGVLEAFEEAREHPLTYLRRHARGDWGCVDEADSKANDEALKHGARILSAYKLSNGIKIWVITEADRTSTCILLPSEY